MSRSSRESAARAREATGRRAVWGLALWFGLGLIAAVPLNLAAGALGPRAEAPAGGTPLKAGGAAPPPAAFEGMVQKGFDLIAADKHGEAFDVFQKAVALGPSEPEPYLGLAEVYLSFQLPLSAEEAYRKAIRLDATCWPAKRGLVKILSDLGRNEESMAILRDLEREMPGASWVWGEKAVNLMRMGRPREAIPFLEKYAGVEGDQAWGFAHLGRALADLGENDKAVRALEEAVKRNPRMGLAQLWLGQVLNAAGRRAEGEEHLKTYNRLQALAVQIHQLEAQINREPDNAQALLRLAQSRALLGQYTRALAPLDRAIELSPGDERLARIKKGLLERIEAEKQGKKAP